MLHYILLFQSATITHSNILLFFFFSFFEVGVRWHITFNYQSFFNYLTPFSFLFFTLQQSSTLVYCPNCVIWSHTSTFLCAQVKAERNSKRLPVLQQASRLVNEMAANVVASTKTGLENLETKGEYNLICVYSITVDSDEHLCNNKKYLNTFHSQIPWTFLGCPSSSWEKKKWSHR